MKTSVNLILAFVLLILMAVPASAAINFNSYSIESFNPSQDVTGTHFVEDGGSTLRLSGNTWKKIDFPYTVTANTVIEFDFASSQQGEVHGIGFETDDVLSADLTFKLYGNQNWGLRDFDTYDVAPGVKHYVIPVGLIYTGAFDRLVFAMDDDANANGESVFSNVLVYDVESIDFTGYSIDSFSPSQDLSGSFSVEDGGTSLRLVGNVWKKIDFPYTVSANTVIEFDFASSQQGEVHGIGFETDNVMSADLTFKLYGTQDWGLPNFDSYDVAPGIKHYVIPVGSFYTGTFDRLVFAMDDDASASGESVFSNVRVYEEQVPAIDFTNYSIDSFNSSQDLSGSFSVEDGGSTLRLTGNTWKKIGFPYTVTANTVIEFDFASSQQGEVHGMGFETDSVMSTDLTFKLYGTQDWGLPDFDSYDVAPGIKHYVIPVGSIYTGTFDRLIFAMDDDASASGESVFSNVRVYEEAMDFTNHSIDSFSPAQDLSGSFSVEDGGSTLRLTGNTWKKIDFPYTVSANTVIEFDFSSSQQGEVHGIGFETDNVLSADLTFKLYGTQDWGLPDFDNYDVAPGFKHYVIPVGSFYTGTFDRLVFAMDDDASASGESVFSNVRVYGGVANTEPPPPEPPPPPPPPPPPEPEPSICDVSSPNLACDLLGYWRFEEPVYFGRKHGVVDYSLTGHHGTPINAVHKTTTGKLGNALSFDGTGEWLTADHQALKTVQWGSVAVWVNTTVNIHPDTYQALFQSGSNTQVQLDIDELGQFRFTLDTDITTYTLLSDAGNNDGKWHHAVATWGSNGLRLFVDGQQVDSDADAVTRPATPEPWYIGAANAGQSGVFKGDLDEAAIWKRQLTSAEVQALYNSGNGRVISMGPVIEQFQPRKAIYQPSNLVSFDLTIDSEKSYTDATIEVWVEREVDAKIQVYSQTRQIVQGAQAIVINWPLSGNGLNNNVQGHLARVTVRDSDGQIIAEKEALFDVVDNWWKVMRLATQGASTAASPGPPSSISRVSDQSIQDRVNRLRGWGFNTFQIYDYAPPWNLVPASDMWQDIVYPDRYVGKDRVAQWGNVLHTEGMKFQAYMDTAAIQGPPEWQLRHKTTGEVWRKYYGDQGYFTPNLNFLSQRWADENVAAINTFGFDGILMDSAYSVGKTTVKYYQDNDRNPLPQGLSVGQYMHDWLGPAKTTVRATKNSFAYVSQNAYPLVYYALEYPLDDIYDKVFATANSQDVWPYVDDVDMWSIEWDSFNQPARSYPQQYDRMAVIMTALVDIVGKPVLQWAFLTSPSTSNIAYIRPKMATYLAARLRVNDHQNFYYGLMNPATQYQADSLQYAQYLRFQTRYSYYLDHADLRLVQQPQITHFELSASKDLFWSRTVYHRLDNGKDEYIINALNLPSNGNIEGQTEIPPTAENVILGIRKSIGSFDVFCLDADDATLVPIEVSMVSENGSYRYFSLPSVRSWQVLVLKEK